MRVTVELPGRDGRYRLVKDVERVQTSIMGDKVLVLSIYNVENKVIAEFFNPLGYELLK